MFEVLRESQMRSLCWLLPEHFTEKTSSATSLHKNSSLLVSYQYMFSSFLPQPYKMRCTETLKMHCCMNNVLENWSREFSYISYRYGANKSSSTVQDETENIFSVWLRKALVFFWNAVRRLQNLFSINFKVYLKLLSTVRENFSMRCK